MSNDTEAAKDQASSAPVPPDLVVEVGRYYRITGLAGFDMDAASQ